MSAPDQAALPMGLKRPEHDHPTWSPAQVAADQRQRLELKAKAPLRGRTDQHDASGLDLFRTTNEPELGL